MEIVLGEIIRRELKARGGESVNELSRRVKIPLSTIHGWVTGATLPNARNLHMVKKLADYFEISLSEMLFGVKEEHGGAVLFSSQFQDSERKYRLVVERLPRKGNE